MQEIASSPAIQYIGVGSNEVLMAIREILLLGNPILRKRCSPVKDILSDETRACVADLKDTLGDFRAHHGFGRGIAAPQIGTTRQNIFVNSDYRGAMLNPRMTQRSRKTFTLWDDCFSFPDILVKVVRHYSITVAFK